MSQSVPSSPSSSSHPVVPIVPLAPRKTRRCSNCEREGHTITTCKEPNLDLLVEEVMNRGVEKYRSRGMVNLRVYLGSLETKFLKIVVKKKGGNVSSKRRIELIEYLKERVLDRCKLEEELFFFELEDEMIDYSSSWGLERKEYESTRIIIESVKGFLEKKKIRMYYDENCQILYMTIFKKLTEMCDGSPLMMEENELKDALNLLYEKYEEQQKNKVNVICESSPSPSSTNSSENSSEGYNCPICLDSNECKREEYVKTNCNHEMCMKCAKDWMNYSYSKKDEKKVKCPLCVGQILYIKTKSKSAYEYMLK